MINKSYKLFVWDNYYSCGGLNDLVGEYKTIEEAVSVAEERIKGFLCGGEYQVADDNLNIVKTSELPEETYLL